MEKAHWTIIGEKVGKKVLCRCSCGTERLVILYDIRAGKSKDCGCTRKVTMRAAQKAAVTKHGMDGTPTYFSWVDMRRRCNNPEREDYPRYGGRGIRVCSEWESSFEAFHRDMGTRPVGKTLDRIDNEGHYTPKNCKWSTRKEQGRNTRANRSVTAFGVTSSLAEACDRHGMNYSTVLARLRRGWDIERALR